MLVYTDGGCTNNGKKSYKDRKMVAVVADEDGKVLSEEVSTDGGSNNIAEILAIRNALKLAIDGNWIMLHIITDSKTAESWYHRSPKKPFSETINNPELTTKIKKEIEDLKEKIVCNVEWKPREFNKAGHYIEQRYKL